jgi:hypothetical protein
MRLDETLRLDTRSVVPNTYESCHLLWPQLTVKNDRRVVGCLNLGFRRNTTNLK